MYNPQAPAQLPESPLSINVRPGRGTEDVQLTIRGFTVADLVPQVQALAGAADQIGEHLSLLCARYNLGAGGLANADQPLQAPPASTPAPQATYTTPPTAAAPPQQYAAAPTPAQPPVQAPTCDHGPRIHRSSKPGAAKAWTAWFCPQPQGAPQCDPLWG